MVINIGKQKQLNGILPPVPPCLQWTSYGHQALNLRDYIHIDWYIYLTSTYYMKKLTSAHSTYNIKHVTCLWQNYLITRSVLAGMAN